jgi:hypothetical protein
MNRMAVLAAVAALTVAGLGVFTGSSESNTDDRASIDIVELHLKANIGQLPVLVIADLV